MRAIAAVVAAAGLSMLAQSPASQPATVWVTANVVHRAGHLVTSLEAKDFEIEDNGQKREIATFRNDRIPVAVAIMVDVSRSVQSNYGMVRRAVSALSAGFQPGDRAIIGSFDALPWIASRFSARPDALQQSLTTLLAGTLFLCDGDWIDKTSLSRQGNREGQGRNAGFGATTEFARRQRQHGGSAVWDAAACGVNAVAADGETPRRVVIIFTDGQDNMSSSTVASVVSRANQYGVMIYTVALMGGQGMAGGELQALAEQTGGGYFYLTGEDRVSDAFARIGDELRHQYVFGFAPHGTLDGHHQIVIKARVPETTTRFRRVQMELPALRTAAAPGGTGHPPASPLPATLTGGGPAAPAPARKGNPAGARRARTPFWDLLDAFRSTGWKSAPRASLAELKSTFSSLKQDGDAWIASAPAAEQPARRLTLAAFVLDLLYSQNDPVLWMENEPAPEMMGWAAGVLESGAATREERLWYFGAIALMERGGVSTTLDRFAQRASRRFPGEGRFLLARAIAQDLRTWPEERDVRSFTAAPGVVAPLTARYEEAAAIPSVKAEASLRLAYFDLRRGRVDAALKRFESIGPEPLDDPIVRFWLCLLKGRALEQAGKLTEAIDSFEQALDEVPAAPSARAALIAALVKARRGPEAARLAASSLSMPPADVDPWTIYILPDMRFWDAIHAEIRTAVTR
jgi:VWFA-related protein